MPCDPAKRAGIGGFTVPPSAADRPLRPDLHTPIVGEAILQDNGRPAGRHCSGQTGSRCRPPAWTEVRANTLL